MRAFLLLLFVVFFVYPIYAKSDTDVTLLKVKEVKIRDNQVIIVGSAITRSRLVDSGARGNFLGRSSILIEAFSDEATFVINQPQLNWKGPDSEEKEKYKKTLQEGWLMTLTAIADLKKGKAVGRIGYYQPTITISKSLIVRIEGRGYLYPAPPEIETTEQDGAG